MNRSGWILLIGAIVLAAAVAAMATRERARSPEEDLRDIGDRMRKGRIDRVEALSELDHLVDRTGDSGDSGVTARVRLARGRVLLDIDALDRAREDFQVVLGLGVLPAKEARDIEDDLIDLDLRAGRFQPALERVKTQIDRDPNDAAAWARKGEIHAGMAERTLTRARELLAGRLLADRATRAGRVLDRLGTMDPADARRPAVGRDLAALFDPGDEKNSQQVLRAADQAARDNERARVALATSLSDLELRRGRSSALAALLDLLDRADRSEEAARLGTCALAAAQAAGDTDAVARMVEVLDHLDRRAYASELGKWLLDRKAPISSERVLGLCDLFYRAERWNDLAAAAARLSQIGNAGEVGKANLYAALGLVHTGSYSAGKTALQQWVTGAQSEPFEGARVEAFRQIADAAGHLHQVDDEIDALESAVALDPDGAGPALLRLAALQFSSPHGGYRRPEEQVAKAMSLMPERTEELAVRWKRMGDQELKAAGLSRAGVLRDPNWRRIIAAPAAASVYELYVLADVFQLAAQPASAESFARRINQAMPTFVPGLDLSIRIQQSLGRTNEVLALLLARMRAAGADTKTRAILSRLSLSRLSPDARLDLMAADPEGFGRREIARGFVEQGEPELALTLVGDGQGANALLEARLVAARACLDTDQPDRAFELLLPLGRHVSSSAAAFDLFARAAARTGHAEELRRATTRAAAGLFPKKTEWLALCDTLLALGDADPAMPLVQRLDSDRRTRGGEVLLRRAWAELLLGNARGLNQTLERAAAFDTKGSVELVGVLAASLTPSWTGLDAAIDALQRTAWRPTRIQSVALLALQGKTQAARGVIDAAVGADNVDPLWVVADFLLAAEQGGATHAAPATLGPDAETEAARFVAEQSARDRRLAWCVLLAQESPQAAGWVSARLAEGVDAASDAAPSLWSEWIGCRLARLRGDRGLERRLLETLTGRWPGFVPAWDRQEALARARGAGEAGFAELRERRLHGLAIRAGTRPEIDLQIAQLQRRQGDLDAALESAREALRADPASSEIRAELGRIHAARGEWKQAVESSVRASHMEKRASDAQTTHDLILALRGAGTGVQPAMPAEMRQAELESLETREPDDPRVPAALAWMDLELDPRNPTIAVAKAFARLDRFLAAHADVALETLCPGADEIWTDLLLALDPARARSFLEGERKRIPAGLEPWLQLGRVDATQPHAKDEVDALDLVRRMAPVGRVLRAHARVHLARAPTLPEIQALARDIRRAEGLVEADAELSMLLAEALFELGPSGRQRAIATTTRVLATEGVEAGIAHAAKLLRAEALIALDRPESATEALEILADLAPGEPDPYRDTCILACRSLANGLAPTTP
ncbi:MAG TPA: tetratricopeptide repeat protein [Planctomycetota bacterium]|jgi:tetratricopeptide (TPR) repeat protein|nr:tetratricopeptide repeat protein [Planctomycetota bacterium]